MVTIGVLAFQGAFAKHCDMVTRLGVDCKLIRSSEDLLSCDGLIIPGGESTVMRHHIEEAGFKESFLLFAKAKPIFGTCAGLILLSYYELLHVTIERNGYGRQIDSFMAKVEARLGERTATVEALFIRAPKITEVHSSHVDILATHNKIPILVKQGHFLAASFHPELTNDPSIHQYFIEEVIHEKSGKKRSLLGYR